MQTNEKQYPIIGYAERDGEYYPIIGIPMMSDEKWNDLARASAIKYLTEQGIEPTEENLRQFRHDLREGVIY